MNSTLVTMLLVGVFVAGCVLDVFLIADGKPGNTWSEVALRLARHPMVVLAVFVIVSHMFVKATVIGDWGWRMGSKYPWFPAIVGIVIAVLFWSQKGSR
jgi:Na+/H+-translocating membrane pyrophosphatase